MVRQLVWAGHGMGGSTEDPRTWESSRLRAILRHTDNWAQTSKKFDPARELRQLCYGILLERRNRGKKAR